jgi:nucleoside-diphosphate-sugar epimerase
MAEQISAWSGIPIVGLRLSNVHVAEDYLRIPGYWSDPSVRAFNLWGYVDVRDAAQACRKALDADVSGAPSYVIAARDTIMNRPSADLVAEVFPGVPVRAELTEYASLLDSSRAARDLGYVAEHSWREVLDRSASVPGT